MHSFGLMACKSINQLVICKKKKSIFHYSVCLNKQLFEAFPLPTVKKDLHPSLPPCSVSWSDVSPDVDGRTRWWETAGAWPVKWWNKIFFTNSWREGRIQICIDRFSLHCWNLGMQHKYFFKNIQHVWLKKFKMKL